MSGTAKSTVHIDNDRVIVTEYRFQRGDSTGWHRHGHDYVIVPLLDGKLKIVANDAITEHIDRSPDFADALSMWPWFERAPRPIEVTIDFS